MTTPLTPGAARKSLGQHFLFDRDLLARIARSGGSIEGHTVVEIGPGPGGLTRALLDAGATPLVAIELDQRFADGLASWPEAGDRLHIHRMDAMLADEAALIAASGGAAPAVIAGNLPYNVGTALFIKWLKSQGWWDRMILMFQKEVAQRICAAPGDAHYGRLAVLTHAVAAPRMAMTLKPGAFRPPPKVDSAIIVVEPLPQADRFEDLDAMETVTAAAFGQRRKMLRASLKSLVQGRAISAEELLERAEIDPTRRAETLDQTEFRKLASVWRSAK
ncbi:MAG: 16S rRNA (adenine(1518)-N(6)/adenine(1519)-N(6))-dimethyltransferase RsmA [Hyphomonadaceae bacterium]